MIMYLIGLCDDEKADLGRTEKMLAAYGEKHPAYEIVTECFESAGALLDMVRESEHMPDLLLLDIYMPERSGIQLAKELRRMGMEGRIVFLTASKVHALEAFRLEATQYLVKPVSEKDLFGVLDRILENAEEERKKYLLLRIRGKVCRIGLNEIVCCEAQGKCQCLYLNDGTQELLRMTMAEIYGMLSCHREFVRIGISYIVNLEHVDSLDAREIGMDTGKKIYLPRGAYPSLREQYFLYYCS